MSELSQLFRWKREVDIIGPNGDKLATVYMRVIGDSEYQEARNAALKYSRALRIKLRDEASDDFAAAFSDMGVVTKDEIINVILVSEVSDYRDEGIMEIGEEKLPVISDNPTLEEQEEYNAQVDEVRENRVTELRKFMEAKSEKRRKELETKKLDELKKLYVISTVNTRCQEEFSNVFREYCVYKGTFSNKTYTKLAFDSFDEVRDSSPILKGQLISSYVNVEISGDQLKK